MRLGVAVAWWVLGLSLAGLLVLLPEVCLGLLLTAGVFKSALMEILPFSIDPTVMLVLLQGVGVVLCLLRSGFSTIVPPQRLFVGFALLAGVMLFSLLLSDANPYAREKMVRFAFLTGTATVAPIAVVRSVRQFRRFLVTIIGLGVLMVLLGTVTGEGLVAFGATHIATGRVVGFALIGMLFFLLESWAVLPVRLFLIAGTGVLGLGLLYSGSRGSLVAFAAALVVTALAAVSIGRGWRRTMSGLVVLVVAVIVVSLVAPAAAETMNHRMSDVFTRGRSVGSVLGRVRRAEEALELFRQHPVTGVGIGGFDAARGYSDALRGDYPHNIMLEVGCELGLLGVAALVFLVVSGVQLPIQALVRAQSRRDLALAATVLASVVYFLVNAMFSGDLNDNRMLFATIGLCWVLPKIGAQETSQRQGAASQPRNQKLSRLSTTQGS